MNAPDSAQGDARPEDAARRDAAPALDASDEHRLDIVDAAFEADIAADSTTDVWTDSPSTDAISDTSMDLNATDSTTDVSPGDTGYCGNGVLDQGEVCDDGVQNSDTWSLNPHCNRACTGSNPHCGDGLQTITNEACDEGNANSDAYAVVRHCNQTCSAFASHCGDGAISDGEACDLGTNNTDVWTQNARCTRSCSGPNPHCGDSTVNGAEVCDQGSQNSNAWRVAPHCNASCTAQGPHCGDSVVQGANEVCDDGRLSSSTWYPFTHCNETCGGPGATCGDGVVQTGEECGEPGLPTTRYGNMRCYQCRFGCASESFQTMAPWTGQVSNDIVVSGNRAYTNGLGVLSLDMLPTAFQELRASNTWDIGTVVGLQRGLVATRPNLTTVQFFDPDTGERRSSTTTVGQRDARLIGEYLYGVGESSSAAGRLVITRINGTDPATTLSVSDLPSGENIQVFDVQPPLLVAGSENAVTLFDVSDPRAPVVLGAMPVGVLGQVLLSGRSVFVTMGVWIIWLDFTVPGSPVEVGRANLIDFNLTSPSSIGISGRYLFAFALQRGSSVPRAGLFDLNNQTLQWMGSRLLPDQVTGGAKTVISNAVAFCPTPVGHRLINLCCPSGLYPCT